ncbi:MAG: peptidoglycan editing factor PgeF [Moorea sp. SIO1F2]|uniref:peptidoglycan editing factor PgeF n=1 Tax=unclassified Moorena TaxID=2683338 RepID=UPI0013B5D856|nr:MULTISPECIES: peptidoglycan editing factor PgeF [unclassified Moorena]NEN99569.1 peptidoglycan editing factor PgeF [Moorena sp. SIO3I7]NEO09951.1 peptidoglycan editing factor PgeF [Moorena sp. SIO3I8]NEO23837.1 peptidoglycan editing factor PgeF [Moorena sp. SIO4A5]NEP24805.1 peptidoglycan editing factor PgeF [Moorena sp. SIO3I6]NEQ61176.1 peptidoglycan editing factor PgeF [Moorena sp. SIO4A1]
MHTWHWDTWNNLPYLTSSLLKQWNHGFFSSAFSPRSPEEMVDVLQPDAQVYRVKQVHGNTVLTPGEIESTQNGEPDSNKPPADGIISEEANQAVWVCTADCTPLLIGDMETGQVAAIHAGWRGTAQRIVPNAIARLLNNGSRKENLRIALGPAITGECYQVSETVAAEVGASIVSTDQGDTTESILGVLQQLDDSPILDDPKPGRVRLDVRRVNVLQLEQLGIDSEQIAIAPHCTYSEPERFFSYRRNQLKKVQWSGIISY